MCPSIFRLLLGSVVGMHFGGRSTGRQTGQGRAIASRAVPVDQLRGSIGPGMYIWGNLCLGKDFQ
jgi:hypothetical protein